MTLEKELPSKDAKINFMKGLIRIAKADGKVDDLEWKFYYQASVALGLNENELNEIKGCWESQVKPEVIFSTSREKMFFFIQAIQLCWIDNSYTNSEKEEIQYLEKELGVNSDSIARIEEWVHEGIIWNNKGDLLLELQ